MIPIPFFHGSALSGDITLPGCMAFGPGSVTQRFALRLAEYLEAPFVLPVASGTVGLQIAAQILLPDGGKIKVPAYGPVQVPNAFRWLGYVVCTGPGDVECHVDFSGQVNPSGEPEIEDACAAFGRDLGGKKAGTWGCIGVLSFGPMKPISCGQGGALVFYNEGFFRLAEQLVNHGGAEHGIPGTQARMANVNATIGLKHLERIDEIMDLRRQQFDALNERVKLWEIESGVPMHNIIHVENARHVVAELQRRKIDARHNYRAIWNYPGYEHLEHDEKASWWEQHAVYLPFGPGLDAWQINHLASMVREVAPEAVR